MRKILSLLKRKRKYKSYIIGNYILFTVVFAGIVMVSLTGLAFYINSMSSNYIFYEKVYEIKDDLINGNADDVDISFLKNIKGWIDITLENGEHITSWYPESISKEEADEIVSKGEYDTLNVAIFDAIKKDTLIAVVYIPEKDYFTRMDDNYELTSKIVMWTFLIVVSGGYIILLLVLTRILGKRIERPIQKIKEVISEYSNRKEEVSVDISNVAELAELVEVFNRMTRELKASEDEREQLETSRIEMLASLSHDIKTPLASVQGYTRAIKDGYVDKDKIDNALEIIDNKSKEVIDMVNLMHEYIKVQHTEYTLNLTTVDLVELLREWIAESYEEIVSKGYDIVVDLPDEVWKYSMDILHFKRAFMNLITNSVIHNNPGVEIKITLDADNDYYHLYIEDNGKGIDMSLADYIMKPFNKGDISRNSKGSGLGLAISSQIITKHMGVLNIDTPKEPYHTRFHIMLKK